MNTLNPLFADVLANFANQHKTAKQAAKESMFKVYIEPFEVRLTKPGFDPRDPEGWLEVIPTEEQMDKAVNWLCDKYSAELCEAVAKLCNGEKLV